MIFFSPPEQANYTSGDGHHMRSLDALKGIAILGTVMVHATDSFRMELPKLVGNLTYEGARGVKLFFIIAAFLTFRSLNRRQEKWEGFSGYWKWVLSRYVRLAPLFWLLLISRIALNGGWSHFISNTGDLIGLLSAFLLLHGLSPRYHVKFWAPGWYIGTLFLFYLIAPYLAKKIKSLYAAVGFFIASILFGYGISRLLELHISSIPFFRDDLALAATFLFDWLPFQLPVLALGIILYFLSEKMNGTLLWNRKTAYGLLFLSLVVIAVLIELCPNYGATIYAFAVAFSGIFISQAIHPCRILVNPLWEALGRRSYGIYIVHTTILGFLLSEDCLVLDNPVLRMILYVILCMAGSWLAAVLLDYLFERPVKRMFSAVFRLVQRLKQNTRRYLCGIAAVMVIPVFMAILIFGNKGVPITISATGESSSWTGDSSILLNGYMVEGKFYAITPDHISAGNWAFYEEDDVSVCGWTPGRRDELDKAITLLLPHGDNRSIVFNSGPFRGIAEIISPTGETVSVDTYAIDKGGSVSVEIGANYNRDVFLWKISQFSLYTVLYVLLLGALCLVCNRIGQSHTFQKLQRNGFLFQVLVRRDFTKKYKRTVLGIAWSMLSPLLQLLVMWLVFNRFFGNNVDHYVVYLFAGQLVFTFFTDSTNSGMEALLGNSDIFTKVNVPKYLFLLSKNVSTFINFALTLIIFFIFVAVDGLVFSWKYVLLLYPILCLMVFNIGTGFLLSAMYVFFRDIQYLWGVFTMLLMYLSAIFYTIDGYSPFAQKLFLLNPIYVYIRYFRKIVIDGTIPSVWFHLVGAGYALIMICIGAWVYKKYNHEFLYYV